MTEAETPHAGDVQGQKGGLRHTGQAELGLRSAALGASKGQCRMMRTGAQ